MEAAILFRVTQYRDEELKAIYERLSQYTPADTHSVAEEMSSRVVTQDISGPKEPRATIFESIKRLGHGRDFEPEYVDDSSFVATDAPVGSKEKIEVLRLRVERGQPLWHNDDRVDYSGLNGTMADLTSGRYNRGPQSGDTLLNCSLFPAGAEDEGCD
jgi:hypothetical protein